MRGIKPPALFELRALSGNEDGRWRMEDGVARFAILHFLSSIVVLKWRNAVGMLHLPEGTDCLANRPSPLVRLTFQKWSAWQDLHLQPFRLERNASSLGYTRLVPTVGLAPTLCAF